MQRRGRFLAAQRRVAYAALVPKADTSIPPPLRALGGWDDAEWFCPSILSEEEVVGLTLPKLPGIRKQNFHLVERSALQPAAKNPRGSKAAPARKPPAAAAGIGPILDGLRVIRAAAFRKPTFFFEGPPILYFADIPAASLKIRAADTLRRDLIQNALRGCVVRQDGTQITAMFWPSAEAEITAFVSAAAPPYPMHIQFAQAEADRAVAGRPAPEPPGRTARAAPDTRDRRRQEAERADLLHELETLRRRISELQQSQSAVVAMETLGLNDARLKSMLLLLHPDKHANSEAATEAAKWVNGLRDLLKASR